ncbi:uncharacterized protein LOC109851617 [Pseudomyrmex gracilis]|uniref:uncharacterized protein LOC109851617 n=1 Tax=Pseudomyrmex gracilis TaxID=219809 RepID=UPI000995030B|nr:uncharacterized protein LOC109851617 [Pseudomyrmex gracilis]XP_020277440.1 uncharacterized protein LOC109851617 [Pseudomyrmex gracilis]
MSTTDPNEIVPLQYTECIHDGYHVDDRIDLSDFQLNDNDDWLYIPSQCSTESVVHDLYAWLKTEPEINVTNTRKCIDTRTFTRPKKRSARMSFESIFEGLASLKNTWKLGNTDMCTEHEAKCLPEMIKDSDFVPSMLKPSAKLPINILSEENSVISGQESMEAFLNMSQSNGIDSFINLREPEFSDILWNTSQPSLFYASLISSTNETYHINDTMPVTDKTTAQISSDVRKESNSSSDNETILIQDSNDTITLNKTNCTNSSNDQSDKGLNETYNAEMLDEVLSARSSLEKEKIAALSSTFVTESNAGLTFVHQPGEAGDDVKHLDITYLSSAKDAEKLNLPISIKSDIYKADSVENTNKAGLNVTCNILTDNKRESTSLLKTHTENVLDMTFEVPECNQSTPTNPNMLNASLAAKYPDEPRQNLYFTMKAPTSLRRELLAEIQRSCERNQDLTYNHIANDHPDSRDTKENIRVANTKNETDVALTNRYHTYKKSAWTAMTDQYRGQKDTAVTAQKDLPIDQRKFYTFTKKSNNSVEKTDNTAVSNAVETHSANIDGIFCKPLPPKKHQQKKMLSRLPQFLQKSNPNLVSSSLKTVGSMPEHSYANIPTIGYMKGLQPNVVQNVAKNMQLSSKLHPYGKLKSGSEQRLLEVNVNTNHQFPIKNITAGSTESIESIQSAQSAPDLDDRHSTCSDSSNHDLCVKGTMNIEELHNLVRMQEESLKQDLPPKSDRRVLENTWVEEKANLLSPILKNGVKHSETDRYTLDTDLSMKCSTPISPTESHHTLNNEENPDGNVTRTKDKVMVAKRTEDPNQAMPKNETKTRLRQPTSWHTGNKPATVISGIPRPASRIPALRFARPNAKPQADLRKGCS